MPAGKCVSLTPLEETHLEKTKNWANDFELNSSILRVLPVNGFAQRHWFVKLCNDQSKIVFAVTLLENGEHIGNCGFYNIDLIHRRGELWLLIGEKEHHSKGYGKEIVRLMLEYGFDSLNLNRIYLHVRNDCLSAVRLYEGSGFKNEGLLKSHYFIQGQYLDILIMSILRKDYGVI